MRKPNVDSAHDMFWAESIRFAYDAKTGRFNVFLFDKDDQPFAVAAFGWADVPMLWQDFQIAAEAGLRDMGTTMLAAMPHEGTA